MIMLRSGSTTLALILLAGSAGVEAAPLHEAARAGDRAKVEVLLAEGADLHARNENDYLPLHSAVDSGRREVVELLLAHGAEVDGRGVYSRGMTALHLAADNGLRDIAELLLANGADINANNTNRSTPLALAVNMGRMDVIQLLVDKGADIYATDGIYGSILGQAMAHDDSNETRRKILELLIAQDGAAGGRTTDGQTALHLAAASGKPRLVEFFVAKGIDINTRDNEGLVPLHYAAIHDAKESIELLLAHGATLEARNNDGRTPLDYAALWGQQENFSLLRARIAALPFSAAAASAIEQGIAAAKKSDYLKAIRLFEIVRAEAPYSPLPLYYLGLAESKIPGRELRAICWFKAFLAAAPDSPKTDGVSAEIMNLEMRSREVLLELIKVVTAAADVLPKPPANESQNPEGSPRDFNMKTVALLWARVGNGDAALQRASRVDNPLLRTLTAIEIALPLALAGDLKRGKQAITTAMSSADMLERSDDRDKALGQATAALAGLGDGRGGLVIAARVEDAGLRCQALESIARAQIAAGHVAAAISTAEAIPVRYYRTSAQAFIARTAAESGDRVLASQMLDLARASLSGVVYDPHDVHSIGIRPAAVRAERSSLDWEALRRGVMLREYQPRLPPEPPRTNHDMNRQSIDSYDISAVYYHLFVTEGVIRDFDKNTARMYSFSAGQALRDLCVARARSGDLPGANAIVEFAKSSESVARYIDGRHLTEMKVGITRAEALKGDIERARMHLVAARSYAGSGNPRAIDEASNRWIAANEYLLNDTMFTSLPEHLKAMPNAFPQQTFSALIDTTLTMAEAQATVFALQSRPLYP